MTSYSVCNKIALSLKRCVTEEKLGLPLKTNRKSAGITCTSYKMLSAIITKRVN